ncbi:hydroxyacid dehydrogenase [Kribbella shirazensis]|uniref:Phosphoglycerate dehydrogenase-like enzyme n=1 Tax=Kribbella shirazensis TaxID=1105143 RepID=A0A7X5VDB1_9ACTN|nr:hydroxyacid dehydrogenase [Kribbella shirazensis]NIK58417.1 phosphoglycerate dehydrogenase-like enzyme [Kribbella shirazensis]
MAELNILCAVAPDLRRQFFGVDRELRGLGDVRMLDDPAKLVAADLAGVDVLMTSWATPQLNARLITEADALRLVMHTGASVKPIVTRALFDRGVRVSQAGQGMARSVAEVALTFTLMLLHQVPRFDRALRSGATWDQAECAPPRHELAGCRVGVLGASRTGRAYLALVRALGADVAVSDPTLSIADADALGVALLSVDDLLRRSQIVALHAPVLRETRHLIGARELALMPDGAALVNTARSWLTDEAALLTELRSGRLSAGLDVFDIEPLPVDAEIRSLPNVVLTPHQAAGTVEGRLRQGRIVLDEIERFRTGQPLEHEVTRKSLRWMG